jgi:hypothetical protein
MEYDEVPWDEDLMKSGSKCQKQKTIGEWLVDGIFFFFFFFWGAFVGVGLCFCNLMRLKKLMVLHLCNLCQGD